MERRLAAILAADVVGYSRLMGGDEEATMAMLNAYREVIGGLVVDHRGRVFGSAGDSVIAEFASPVEAVRCALEMQRELERRNAELVEDRRMRFRVGVNLGDVMAEGGDLLGDGVNIAARLEKLAEPGGVCISGTVFEHIEGKIDLAIDDLGEQRVKNITKAVRVYSVSLPETEAATGPSEPIALSDKPSIAVLPFVNMSGDPEQAYFSDGITEDIITALSRFRSLFVMARTSTFAFKGKSVTVQDVGRELGVGYVVEGSVRKAGNRVRITAQLIEAATGNHVWAERYDRDVEDIFAVQDDVAQMITSALVGRVELVQFKSAKQKRPSDLAAYDYLLRGREKFYWYWREPNQEAQRLLETAVELDPSYGRAYAYLALTHYAAWQHGWARVPGDSSDRFFELAERSVALEGEETITHIALAMALLFRRHYDEARHHIDKALSLNPNDPEAIMVKGYIDMFDDRAEEAIELVRQAMRLNPFGHYGMVQGIALFSARRPEEAIAAFKMVRAKVPLVQALLAACHAQAGAEAESRAAAERLADFARSDMEPAGAPIPDSWIEFLSDRLPYRTQADRDHLHDSLRQAGLS